MNPRIARIVLVGIAAAAVVVAALTRAPTRDLPPLTITYVYSTDAAPVLDDRIKEFNASGVEVGDQTIHVNVMQSGGKNGLPSGRALRAIEHRYKHQSSLDPVVWTPASSMWGKLLNDRTGTTLAHSQSRSLLASRQVVAVFKDSVKSLRERHIEVPESWGQVLDLAQKGALKVGHPDPNISTSGLSALVSEFYLAADGQSDGDARPPADIEDPLIRGRVEGYENAIAHYSGIARDFKDAWCRFGADFADAAYMQETTFIDVEKECEQDLVAKHPNDVPLVADYPFIVLDAPWVSPNQKEAAHELGRWLRRHLGADEEDCKTLKNEGFRTQSCGNVPKQPPLPTGEMLSYMQQTWKDVRPFANVMLVVDHRSELATMGLFNRLRSSLSRGAGWQPPFVDCPVTRDRVGLIVFGGENNGSLPIQVYSDAQRSELIQHLGPTLRAERGDSPHLYDAIDSAIQSLRDSNAPAKFNSIVILASADDDGSKLLYEGLKDELRQEISQGQRVQLVVVAYGGAKEARAKLRTLAFKTYGRYYSEDPRDVASVSDFVCQFL
jgi:Ca-activated chloride channel homolog